MVIHKKGNAVSALIDDEIDYLLNCVNCQGKYASGIAKEIREKLPRAYERYERFYRNTAGKMLGELDVCGSSGVIHLAAQDRYGYDGKRYVNYGALASCLIKLKNMLVVARNGGNADIRLGVPYNMCCGLAGGDWNIVLEMVEFFLKDFTVIVYELES